jgi:hypothetical protein
LNSVADVYALTTPIVAISIQLFAIILFVEAALHKAQDYKDFVSVLSGYKLIPISMIWVVAGIVILVESFSVLGLLLTIPYLKYLAASLLIIYAIAIEVNVLRGRTEIDCGCGGRSLPISQALVSRNLVIAVLLAGSTYIVGLTGILQVGIEFWPLIAGTVMVFGCLYLSYNQLCLNQGLQKNLIRKTS